MNNFLKTIIFISGGFFVLIIIIFLYLNKKMNTKKTKYLQSLTKGTKRKKFSYDAFLQKVYIFCTQTPVIRRYTLKIRRRIEILNLADEYLTREETAKVMLKTLPMLLGMIIAILVLTGSNTMLKVSLIAITAFFYETIVAGRVDKLDTKLLKDQIEMFAEMRHAYHDYNMVEEAIYEVAQDERFPQVGAQFEKVYEILISDDPEMELEKYYDIAPNSYLKEFAGISYLTREFGDRKEDDGASLYLKNLNNITQEMQIEILKRERIDYLFQSLSLIAMVPIFFIEIVKKMAVNLFAFTKQFYYGKAGLLAQVAMIVIATVCFILIRKIKDESNTDNKGKDNPWQAKLYDKKYIKTVVDWFVPKEKTKDRRIKNKLLKDSASPLKIQWLYVTKLTLFVVSFILMFFIIVLAHKMQINYIYNEPTADYDLLGNMGEVDMKKAVKRTENHNKVIDKLKSKKIISNKKTSNNKIEKSDREMLKSIKTEMKKTKDFEDLTEKEKDKEAEIILDKIKGIQYEYFKWFELLISFAIAFLAYATPEIILKMKYKMRLLEMENEVMEYHTIILMLMKIERVNVEMMLEWIERYANIFKEPLTKCVNNFESGPWESLEELKNDVSFPQFIRIVESLQAAVEKIPIREAFDEIDTERQYYQDRRKEANNQLIDRKVRIGKIIGFTPMILLFVGYLIIPMVGIGFTSMSEALGKMEDLSN